jgi:hypothetical protein
MPLEKIFRHVFGNVSALVWRAENHLLVVAGAEHLVFATLPGRFQKITAWVCLSS